MHIYTYNAVTVAAQTHLVGYQAGYCPVALATVIPARRHCSDGGREGGGGDLVPEEEAEKLLAWYLNATVAY